MATELCKYVTNKGTDPLVTVLRGVMFEDMISVSQTDPFSEGPGSKEFAEGFYFLVQ